MNQKLFAALALTLFASPVLAEEGKSIHHGRGAEHFMKKVDTDKDGKISKPEFMAKADKHFTEADTNKDGFITAEEGKAAHEARRAKWKAMRAEYEKQNADKVE